MSANEQPSGMGKKLGLVIGILLAIAVVFIVVMCTAGTPTFLKTPADFPAPNN